MKENEIAEMKSDKKSKKQHIYLGIIIFLLVIVLVEIIVKYKINIKDEKKSQVEMEENLEENNQDVKADMTENIGEVKEKDVIFSEPEDAIRYYYDGIKRGDIDQSLKACMIQEYTTDCNFEERTLRLNYLMPLSQLLLPNQYDFYAEYNGIKKRDQWAGRICNTCICLLSDLKITEGQTVSPVDESLIDKFVSDIDPSKLKDLSIERIDYAFSSKQDSDENQKNYNILASNCGGEKYEEYVVLLEYQGIYYLDGFCVCKLGDHWKIDSKGLLSGMSFDGGVAEITMDEYMELIR